MQIGYKLASEAFGPKELIRQAVRAEPAGRDLGEHTLAGRVRELGT